MKPFVTSIILAMNMLFFAQVIKAQTNMANQPGFWYAYEPVGGIKAANELFSFSNNSIRLFGKQAGYLMSKESFSNFTFSAEFRWNLDSTIVAASKKKNSGIMYLVPEETPDTLWPKGIQFQIKEGATGDFVLLKEVSLTVNNQSIVPGSSVVVGKINGAEKPFGEWNLIEISCKNGHIVQKLNGVLVNEGTNPSVSKGRILLQYEGYPIDFRNITAIEHQ